MYADWFKLKHLPLRLRPDHEMLFGGTQTARILELLKTPAASDHRLTCLVGTAGVGKTTLLHAIAAVRQRVMPVARIQQPNLTFAELIESLANQIGQPPGADPSQARSGLNSFVTASGMDLCTAVVLIDDAHECDHSMLRDLLRLACELTALEFIIAGNPPFERVLESLEEADRTHRITTLRITPLESDQIFAYLDHRLRMAGGDGRQLFDSEALPDIVRYTEGTPKLINVLCDTALALAAANSLHRVSAVEIRDAARELKWVEFAARPMQEAIPTSAPSKVESVALPGRLSPEVQVLRDGEPFGRVQLKPGRLVIGRGEDAGLRLDSKYVSKEHCQLITTNGQSRVEDMGSTNGVWINGKRHERYVLAPQDNILIGNYNLIYIEAATRE